jgi:hypothetical protein
MEHIWGNSWTRKEKWLGLYWTTLDCGEYWTRIEVMRNLSEYFKPRSRDLRILICMNDLLVDMLNMRLSKDIINFKWSILTSGTL